MNEKEHKQYLREFKAWSKEISSTRQNALDFLIRTGINTPTGKLTKAYTSNGKPR